MTIEEIIDYVEHKIEELNRNALICSYLYIQGKKDAYLDILEILEDHKIAISIHKVHVVDGFKYPTLTDDERFPHTNNHPLRDFINEEIPYKYPVLTAEEIDNDK